jgi:poly-gamma-glutamate system protein
MNARIHLVGAIGLAAFALLKLLPNDAPPDGSGAMRRASEIMAGAEARICECRARRGIPPDPANDINRTGLIGVESSPITTTLGDLEAKRTVTNPNFAGLAARLLAEAGVKRGDTIALGASGSFPGLILAVLSAAGALDIDVVGICSLGASQWGANDPRFDWLDISACAAGEGVREARWAALTMGGEGDIGSELPSEGRRYLVERIRLSGLPTFQEPDLARNVGLRLRLYEEKAGGKRIRAFVNVGGSWANMGTDSAILRVGPGLSRVGEIPPKERRGVLQEMAARGIPVIHLLNVKGLAMKYGLPLDPGPLPAPGEGEIYLGAGKKNPIPRLIGWAYFVIVLAVLAIPALISRFSR